MQGGQISATQKEVCNGLVPGEIKSLAPASGGTGSGITYQWQSSVNAVNWNNIPGASQEFYQPGAITTDIYFRRRATNGNGSCDTTYAGPEQIALYKVIDPGTIQSGDTTVCMGTDVTVRSQKPAGNGNPATTGYLWQHSVSPFTVWTDIAGSGGESFTETNVTVNTKLRRITTNQCGTDTTAESYEIKVLPNLVTGVSFGSVPAVVCNVDEVKFTVTTVNAGPGRTIDWYYNNSQFLLPSGSPDSVYIRKGNTKDGDKVKVIVHADPSKLCTTPSGEAEIILKVNTVVSSDSNRLSVSDTVVCSGESNPVITGTAASGSLGNPPYLWQVSSDEQQTWTTIPGAVGKDHTPAEGRGTHWYRRIALSAGACKNDTSAKAVKIRIDGDSFDPGTLTGDPEKICQGAVPTFVVTKPQGGVQPYGYQWEKSTDNSIWVAIDAATNEEYVSDTLDRTTYFRRRVFTAGKCEYITLPLEIRVDNKVDTSSNKISGDHEICLGSPAQKISGSQPSKVSDTTTVFTYQWVSKTATGIWEIVPGGTGRDLENPGTPQSTTWYRRIVTSTGACAKDTSSLPAVKVTVDSTVDAGLVLNASPVCRGKFASLKSDAKGGSKELSYQWQSSRDSLSWENPLAGDHADYSTIDLDSTTWFRVIVKSGICVDTTDAVAVRVDQPVADSTNDATGEKAICIGASAPEIKLPEASGGLNPKTYQWEVSEDSTSWSPVAGGTGKDLAPGELTKTSWFRRVVTSTGACDNAISKGAFKIFVDPALSADSIQKTSAICRGTAVVLKPELPLSTGNSSLLTYQWQISADSVIWADLPDQTSDTLHPQLLDSSMYMRLLVSSVACKDTTAGYRVQVDQPVVDSTNYITGGDSICAGSVPAKIIGSDVKGGIQPKAYKWLTSEDLVSWKETDSTGINFTPGQVGKTTYYKRLVTSTGACENAEAADYVTVFADPELTANVTEQHLPVCEGAEVTLAGLVKGGTSPVFQWQKKTSGSNWEDMTGKTDLNLITTLKETTSFRLKVISAVCEETSAEVSIRVDKRLADTVNRIWATPAICFNDPAPVVRGTSVFIEGTETTYKWLYKTKNSDWKEAVGATGVNYSPSEVKETTWFRRLVTSMGACESDSSQTSAEVYVDPTVTPGEIGDDQQFCNEDTLYIHSKVDASGGTEGILSYNWLIKTPSDTIWKYMPGKHEKDLKLKKSEVPVAPVVWFLREARSVACVRNTDTVSIYSCNTPEFPDGDVFGGLCMNEKLRAPIVSGADTIRNRRYLIAKDTLLEKPKHGNITVLDTANNVFEYTPFTGFWGTDSVTFKVCDTTRFGKCGAKTIYISLLEINLPPVIVNDTVITYRNISIEGDINSNNSDPDKDTLYVYTEPLENAKNGTFRIGTDGRYSYTPYPDFKGTDRVVVRVCDTVSRIRCLQTLCGLDTIFITVKPNSVNVPDGYSPNNDGKNDVFFIRTEAPSNIHIAVYNRWGNLVYENKHYLNDWDGRANRGLVIGEGLPDGTYYLYYNINDGEYDGFKYITLNR
jgi:gliding motility-associated-like protein